MLTEKNILGTTAEIEGCKLMRPLKRVSCPIVPCFLASTSWLEDLGAVNKIIMEKYRQTDVEVII